MTSWKWIQRYSTWDINDWARYLNDNVRERFKKRADATCHAHVLCRYCGHGCSYAARCDAYHGVLGGCPTGSCNHGLDCPGRHNPCPGRPGGGYHGCLCEDNAEINF